MISRLSQNIALAFFLLAGLLGVVAPKGITILVGLTGATGILMWWFDAKARQTLSITPVLILVVLFVWAGISSSWALDPTKALFLSLRLILISLLGLGLIQLIKSMDLILHKRMENTLLIGYGLGIAVLIVGYAYVQIIGDSLWGSYFFDPLTTLNNGAVVLSLLFWPVAAVIWKRYHPIWVVSGLTVFFSGLLFLPSGAALFVLVVGLVTGGLVLTFGKTASIACMALTVIATLTAPLLASRLMNPDTLEKYSINPPPSAMHRLAMWQFVVKKINEKPGLGWGMDASRAIPQDAFRLRSNMEIMPLHPHNAALQIRLELGWPGIIISTAFLAFFFLLIFDSKLPRPQNAIRTGVAYAYLAVGSVSYGVWQNWWIAVAWVLAASVALVTTLEKSTK